MHVLLVKTPACYTDGTPVSVHNYGPPMGLLTMQKYLRNRGHDATIRIMDTFDEVSSFGPYDIVGITSMTATRDSCYHVSNLVKERFPDKTVLMGGPHCNGFSEAILNHYPSIDGVVEGEGEGVLHRIVRGDDWADIPGLASRGADGKVRFTRGHSCIDIEEVVEVDFDAADTLGRFINTNTEAPSNRGGDTYFNRENRFLNIVDGRGCRGTCIFCGTPRTWGTNVRQVRPLVLVDMLERLGKKYEVNSFFFSNDNFVDSTAWIETFCGEILRRKMDISWWCLGRVDLDYPEFLRLMAQAGCYKIKYGVESGSGRILDSLGKRINFDQIINTVEATRKVGMETACGFMVGFPGETVEDMDETIRFANSLRLNSFSYTATMLFPGTAIFRRALKEGKITERDFLVETRDAKAARRARSIVCRETQPIYVPDGFEHDPFLDLCDANFHRIESTPFQNEM